MISVIVARRIRGGQRLPAARRVDAGFTLVEIAITLVLAGILATLALPSYRNLILNQHVKTSASDLQISMLFARSEAIKRAANILIVPASSDWKNGWSVQLADATEIRARPALDANLAAIAGSTITYGSDGHVGAAPGSLVFKVTGNTSVTARCVILDLSGRPSMISDTDHDPSNGCN